MSEPTNWNIRPRHPTHAPKRHYKTFLRPPEEPEPSSQPFAPEVPVFEPVRVATPQEVLVKSFVLGGLVLLLWGVHEPAQLEQLTRRLKEAG